jgi:hypothetical protein
LIARVFLKDFPHRWLSALTYINHMNLLQARLKRGVLSVVVPAVMIACNNAPTPLPGGAQIPTGGYACLLLTYVDGLTPGYVPSVLGTIIIKPGNGYEAQSFSGAGTYSLNAARTRVSFQGGALNGVNAAFERLDDGTPLLRFGEKLGDPTPDVTIGESVCRGDRP